MVNLYVTEPAHLSDGVVVLNMDSALAGDPENKTTVAVATNVARRKHVFIEMCEGDRYTATPLHLKHKSIS
jgi:hypothetical protein